MPFQEALAHAQKLESYMSPGERAFLLCQVDPRLRVNEALADLSSAFLDRGSAKWAPRCRDKGFLYFFASLEGLGFAPWRRHAREAAQRILEHYKEQEEKQRSGQGVEPADLAETILWENLRHFGVPPREWADSIRAMALELRGWAGMFRRMESRPLEAPPHTRVRLVDFCAVQSILVRSSIEQYAQLAGWDEEVMPLAVWLAKAPKIRSSADHHHGKHAGGAQLHPSTIAYVDQCSEWRELLETEFQHTLLNAISSDPLAAELERPHADQQQQQQQQQAEADPQRPALQLYTCIDDREGSLRRHVEEQSPREIETFGVAGFFGIPIRYEPADGGEQMVLAPEGQEPTAVLVEGDAEQERALLFRRRRRWLARLSHAWESASFSPAGSLLLSCFAPLSMLRLILMGFNPRIKSSVKDRMRKAFLPKRPRTDFKLPFPPEQAAALLARTFKDIGTHRRFAPIVIVLGHGAVSVNNPFAAAYNCGACGGREGGPNARLLARLANDREVRACLQRDHDVTIPDDTVFIGGLHNTTTDAIELYDLELVPESHSERLLQTRVILEEARGRNALERCQRFLLAENVRTPADALRHVRVRATDFAEVRPELNHATNAAVVVGRRELTKLRFLDRRVFLPSYDPYSDDAVGTNLEHVLGPALIVCSGINLEYLFSTVAVDHHGAGTKAPLNVVGNIGVIQGTSGDLRPGLPAQMTEMHTPVRALYVVDAPIERVEAVLSRREDLRRLVRNEWVRFFVRDPETGRFYRQSQGKYLPVNADETLPYVPFTPHRIHGLNVARRETIIYWAAATGMLLAAAGPILLFGPEAMNPRGSLIAVCGTLLALPVLAFSRRYLHGEFMFPRFMALCVGLLLGFNRRPRAFLCVCVCGCVSVKKNLYTHLTVVVATAPTLAHAMAGWSLFGFASTFLIGAYNDRATVRNNATFAFAAYRISDFALLVAAAFSGIVPGVQNLALTAGGLLLAALLKSSQFPLSALFARSMEGPTPASALGYAGLSAHVGVVLLTSTMPLWFVFDWARITLGAVGLISAAYGTLVAKVRADRKGAIAHATSATLGLIYVILALGHVDLALLLSLGHAAFRMVQILRTPNIISDTRNLRAALGRMPWPKLMPDWLYRICWRLRRIDSDFHLLNVLHWMTRKLHGAPKPLALSKHQQWLLTSASVVLAGAPFTPVSHYLEELLMQLLPTQPLLAGLIMFGHFGLSVVLIRFLFLKVLDGRRSQKKATPSKPPRRLLHQKKDGAVLSCI